MNKKDTKEIKQETMERKTPESTTTETTVTAQETTTKNADKKPQPVNPDSIAGRVTALRKGSRWSQEKLADKMHVGLTVISKIERDHREPTLAQVIELATIFGTSCDYILLGEQPTSGSTFTLTKEDENMILALSKKIQCCRFRHATCQTGNNQIVKP